MTHGALPAGSKVKLLQLDVELQTPRQTVICHSPHTEGSPPCSCLTLSETTAGFQQAGVICHKTNCYKSVRQI